MTTYTEPDSSNGPTAPGTSRPPLLLWLPYRIPSRNRLDAMPLRQRMAAKREAKQAFASAVATAERNETRPLSPRCTS